MATQMKKPKVRFDGFTEDWDVHILGENADIGDGLHGTPTYTENGDIYFINGNNLIDGKIIVDNETKKVLSKEQSNSDKELNDKTILLSINGTVGNLAFYQGEKVMLGKSVAHIRLKSFSKEFIYHYLKSPIIHNHFLGNLTGSTIKNLGLKTLRETEIWAPRETEQIQIGTYFENLERIIKNHQTQLTKLNNLKKAMLAKMFPQNEARVPEIRFKGFDGEWDKKKLGNFTRITTGVSNREDSGLDGEFTFFDRSEDIRRSDIYLFDCEAIIVAGEGSDFVPKYFRGKFDLHQRTYAIMDFQDSDAMFLFYYIHLFRNYFLDVAVGSTVKSLRLPMFQEMDVIVPKKDEQEKISVYFKELDTLISSHLAQLKKLNNIKKACLSKLFVA